jgi:hypothetical protein
VALAFAFVLAAAGTATARTVTVPGDHATIQGAIDAARPGDTIRVAPGVYTEALTIDKRLRLLGAQEGVAPTSVGRPGGESTIVAGQAVIITAGDVELNGFEMADFRGGVSIPGPFPAPGYERRNITIGYNWLHSSQSPVDYGIRVEPGLLRRLVIVHNTVDVLDTDPQRFALAAVELGGGESADGHPTYVDLRISDNTFKNVTRYGVFASADPAAYLIDGLEMNGNTFEECLISFNLGNIRGGEFCGNWVGARGGALGIQAGTISGNTFRAGGRLALWGTEYGFLRPSAHVEVANNEFTCEVTGRGIRFSEGVDDSTITVRRNAFRDAGIAPNGDGVVGYLIRNDGVGSVAASMNWWGHAEGPTAATGALFGPVTATPYISAYVDDPAKVGRPGFWPQVTTATRITATRPGPSRPGASYAISGTVTITGLGAGSRVSLPGRVTVSNGTTCFTDTSLTATVDPGVFAFAGELRSRAPGTKILTATYADTSRAAFFASSCTTRAHAVKARTHLQPLGGAHASGAATTVRLRAALSSPDTRRVGGKTVAFWWDCDGDAQRDDPGDVLLARALTNAAGVASARVVLPEGVVRVQIVYAGDDLTAGSRSSMRLVVAEGRVPRPL